VPRRIDTGRLPDTIRDRSIAVAMRRRTPAEVVERLRWRDADRDAAPLRDRLAWWGMFAPARLPADPAIPPELDDRAAEAWEPLLAIADLAGGEWPRRARAAAVAWSAGEPELSLGAALLASTREAFDGRERMATADLLAILNANEELPFGGWRDGRGLDSRGLARMLRRYGIKPRTIRVGDNPNNRGYLREQFTDAWERWASLPTETPQAPHPPRATDAATREPHEQADVADVAAKSGAVADEHRRGGCASHPDAPAAGCRYCQSVAVEVES
jgi:hypothetical protein